MSNPRLRIATRRSPLALAQAHQVAKQLQHHHPHLAIEFLEITTSGDRFLEKPLYEIGGKSLFVKELELALLNHEADIAVHSMKDVPIELPMGLTLAVFCERADPRDAWISNVDFHQLQQGARVGSSSLRRQAQLKAMRPDLTVLPLRGNVNTRLQQLSQGHFAGIVLAVAGLVRLNFADQIHRIFSIDESLPAIGQGALGIECREDDTQIQNLISVLDHAPTRFCLTAERALNAALGGSCHTPIGGYAEITENTLTLRGLVADPNGHCIFSAKHQSALADATQLGLAVADDLKQQGALKLLSS